MYFIAEAKLYYLYMMVDGEVSDNELDIFNSICRDLGIENFYKQTIIEDCENFGKKGLKCLDIIQASLSNKNIDGDLYNSFFKYDSKKYTAAIIWNLINLGYADSAYTYEEREVVKFLKEFWEIPESLYQEMIDVAETCLSLEKYKTWIRSIPMDEYKKQRKIESIQEDIAWVQKTIKTTISEIC